MATHDVDVVILGMGPGGEDLGGKLGLAGLRVVGIESRLVGGECPYYGCVPSKMIIRAADLLTEARRVNGMAGRSMVQPDYGVVARRIADEATSDWNDAAAVERFEGKGGTLVRGHGVLDGPGRVRVGDDVYVAGRAVVLNTGTAPAIPPVPGLADVAPLTNRDVFKLTSLPDSMIVLGGGAIGAELAQAYARFGVQITVVEALDRLIAPEEPESSALLLEVFRREGIDVRLGVAAAGAARAGGNVTLTLDDGTEVVADEILVAAGRTPNVGGIGLDSVGLDESAKPALTVDDHMRVQGVERLWAIGDITGRGAFTHMSLDEAHAAVDDILGVDQPRVVPTHAVPHVTFTDPEIGSVGLTEAQAREAGVAVAVGVADSATSSRGSIHGSGNDGLMKLVVDTDRDILVGATSAGPRGGDVLSMFNLAVHARTPMGALRSMIYAYPTFYRGALDALDALD